MNLKKTLMVSMMLALASSGSHAEDANLNTQIMAEVSKAVIDFNRSYEVNDLDTYFGFYADGATMWFNNDFVAIADYKKDWYQLVESGGGVEKNTLSDLKVTVSPSGDAAVAAYRLEVHTRQPDGQITRDQSKESDTWFNYEGQWKIAHLHYASQAVTE